MYESGATFLGSLGVTLLLLAFFLTLFRRLDSDGYPNITLNLLGGLLACYSSYLIGFMPFVVLEGTWALVAGIALASRLSSRSRPFLPSELTR